MTHEELERIKVRAAQATKGPWEHISFGSGTEYVRMRDASGKGPPILGPDKSEQDGHIGAHMHLYNVPAFQVLTGESEDVLVREKSANAEFIAHSRQDVDGLMAEVERCWELLGSRKS